MNHLRILLLACLIPTILAASARGAPQKLAVLDFGNPAKLTEQERGLLTDLVRGVAVELPQTGYLILTNILELLPPGTDMATCSRANCEVEYGRMVGAAFVVSGEIKRYGASLKVTLNLHNTLTSALLGSEIASAPTVDALEPAVRQAAAKLLARLPGGESLSAKIARQAATGTDGSGGSNVVVSKATPDEKPKVDLGALRRTWRPETAPLLIKSSPPGATVHLDGERLGATPFETTVPVGLHDVRADAGDLYLPGQWRDTVPEEGSVITVELQPNFGTLLVKTEPSGASCKVGGLPVGKAPVRLERQKAGAWKIECEMTGHFPAETTVELLPKEEKTVRLDLDVSVGSILVTSEPAGAEVFTDGSRTRDGVTPLTLSSVTPGRHKVVVFKDGYDRWEQTVTVTAGKASSLAADLKGVFGYLRVSVRLEGLTGDAPVDAEVFIDGKSLGRTPKQSKELAIEHEVRVSYHGIERTHPVKVIRDQVTPVEFRVRSREVEDAEKRKAEEETERQKRAAAARKAEQAEAERRATARRERT